MDQQSLSLENAKLRHALAAETRMLRVVRDIVSEADAPGVEAEHVLARIRAELGEDRKTVAEIAEAERLLTPDRY